MYEEKNENFLSISEQKKEGYQNDSSKKDNQSKLNTSTKISLLPKYLLTKAKRVINTQNIIIYRKSLVINENTMKGIGNEESFIESAFYFKKIEKIMITEDYLKINMADLQVFPTNFDYIIERFESYGDQSYYNLAKSLQQIQLLMDDCLKFTNQNPEYFKKIINQEFMGGYKGKKYIMYQSGYVNNQYSFQSLIISKKLIQLLGFTPQHLASRFIKLKSFSKFQLISQELYQDFIINYINIICQYKKAMLAQKSNQQIKYLSQYKHSMSTYLYPLNKSKVRVQMTAQILNQCFGLYQIQQLEKVDTISLKRPHSPLLTQIGLNKSKKIKEQQKKVISIINGLPSNELPINKNRVCSYHQIQKS